MEWPPAPPHLPHAACRRPGVDPEWFFPTRTKGQDRSALRRALAICASCPHLQQCRQYALADPKLVGVWGGLSGHQRILLGRRLRKGVGRHG